MGPVPTWRCGFGVVEPRLCGRRSRRSPLRLAVRRNHSRAGQRGTTLGRRWPPGTAGPGRRFATGACPWWSRVVRGWLRSGRASATCGNSVATRGAAAGQAWRRGVGRGRTAVTDLCIGQVELLPPQDRPADRPVTAWVVRVLETEPPAGARRWNGCFGRACPAPRADRIGRLSSLRCRRVSAIECRDARTGGWR